jgi:hypothetical protein
MRIDDGSVPAKHTELTHEGHGFVVFRSSEFCSPVDAAALEAAVAESKAELLCSYRVGADAVQELKITEEQCDDVDERAGLLPRSKFRVSVSSTPMKKKRKKKKRRMYAYERRTVAGFSVDVDRRCLESEVELSALSVLCADVEAAAQKIPDWACSALRDCGTRIVVHRDTEGHRDMCYHPFEGSAWLRRKGFDAEQLRGCVHVYKLRDHLRDRELWGAGGVLVHELSHAYHDR